jgi:hypothetical protein
MDLEEFLEAQGATVAGEGRFLATVEAIADRPEDVKVTPYAPGSGCGCSSALDVPKRMIREVRPTGEHHLCCGKRLAVVEIEFAEDAAIPVAELMRRAIRPAAHGQDHGQGFPMGGWPMGGGMGMRPPSTRQAMARRGGQGFVGRIPIPWTPCTINCIEVCTEFCSDVGWDCCQWETRCAVSCDGAIA